MPSINNYLTAITSTEKLKTRLAVLDMSEKHMRDTVADITATHRKSVEDLNREILRTKELRAKARLEFQNYLTEKGSARRKAFDYQLDRDITQRFMRGEFKD